MNDTKHNLIREAREGGPHSEEELIALLADEIERLQTLMTEHHSISIFDGSVIGGPCPICAKVSQ